ncbi:MAG: pyridoxal-phosphate dependent enzyme [Lachnospiraceae bacterium]|nr:pyridoxal-phosphate dependent enzyme [Lachnospiraceae bacterium]
MEPFITPTPVQEIAWPEAGDNRIFLKRDDLLPYSFGGNKVRIARAFFEDMKRRGNDAMIMYGSPRSNLCRVLSALCFDGGIPAVMISSDAAPAQEAPSFNERIVSGLGVRVIRCTADRIASAVDSAFELLRGEGRSPYYIYGDRTGSGNEACAASAYAEAYGEILSDQERLGVRFDYLYTPYGTGATMGGLICGAALHPAAMNPYIVGISVSSRTHERACGVLEKTWQSYLKELGAELPAAPEELYRLESGYNAGGYGISSSGIEQVIDQMLKRHSVPLDPTYTGKAFLGMLKDLKSHDIHGRNILFLHTGGTPLFFDYMMSGSKGHG